jgi:hypothetical protein
MGNPTRCIAVGTTEESFMRSLRELDSSRHAITDLYDERRRAFLVQYPVWFIVALALTGVATFAITGFFGYGSSVVRQPWDLFLWFCAVLVTLQISIFRSESLRTRLIATLLFTLASILIIGITYFNASLPDLIRQLLQGGRFFRFIATNVWTYTLVNFGIIAIFWADTIRRWIRRARGLPPNPRVSIGIESPNRPEDLPTMQELVSGDLIAGAVLTLALAFVFRPEVLNMFIHPRGADPLTICTVSWPIGVCHGYGGGMFDPPTFTFLDLIQSLLYLPLGLIILALSATISGLGAVGGVDAHGIEVDAPATMQNEAGQSSTMPIAVDVTTTVINTLRSALDRRIRLLLRNIALSLRMVGWPTLIVFATYGLAELSTNIQNYLHSGRTLTDAVLYILPAIGWGALAVGGVVFSAALMLFRWRVADNTFRFLGLIGFILLLTFWIFSLALWGFNLLLLQTHAIADRHPFDPPSTPTAISFVALLAFGVLLLFRRTRAPQAVAQAKVPAAVGASSGSSSASADPSATQAGGPPQVRG